MPIWRAVGGPPASAIKAGKQGVPMMITTLGGPAMNFKGSIDVYRQAATEAGFDASPKSLPVSTASLFYTAETTQDAMERILSTFEYRDVIYSWRWLSETAIC